MPNIIDQKSLIIQDFRLTFFPSAPNIPISPIFMSLFDKAPDQAIQANETAQLIETGNNAVDDWSATVTNSPLRIDINLFKMILGRAVSILGPIPEATSRLNTYLDTLPTHFQTQSFSRLALGVTILKPCPSVADGYAQLGDWLPFSVDYTKSSEFILQVNKKTNITIGDDTRIINRIFNISVTTNQSIMQDISMATPITLREEYYNHLQLDINTLPTDQRIFAPSKIPSYIKQFISSGLELVMEGIREL